jgi:hypothetical protein
MGAVSALATFGAAYLLGAFVEAEFSIADWSGFTRLFVAMCGGALSFCAGAAVYEETKP